MKERQANAKADLHKVLRDAFGVGSLAATRLIQDGQVLIDGYVVLPQWSVGHWSVQQLRGRMISIPHLSLSTRLYQRVR